MSTLLMLLAAFCLALAALAFFTVIGLAHPQGWLATGLTLWAVAVLVGGAGPIVERFRQ